MSNVFSFKDAEKKIKELNIPVLIKHHLNENRQGYNRISRLLGKEDSFLSQQMKRKNPSLAVFYTLSIHLQTNLFEPFQNLLPDHIRPTLKEKQLQQQIEDLQKQVADIAKERDIFKEILMKK